MSKALKTLGSQPSTCGRQNLASGNCQPKNCPKRRLTISAFGTTMQLPRTCNKKSTSMSLRTVKKSTRKQLANQQGRQKEAKTSESLRFVRDAGSLGTKTLLFSCVGWWLPTYNSIATTSRRNKQLHHHESCKIVVQEILEHLVESIGIQGMFRVFRCLPPYLVSPFLQLPYAI